MPHGSGGGGAPRDSSRPRPVPVAAFAATVRSNREAAQSLPCDVDDAEEQALLLRAHLLLAQALRSL